MNKLAHGPIHVMAGDIITAMRHRYVVLNAHHIGMHESPSCGDPATVLVRTKELTLVSAVPFDSRSCLSCSTKVSKVS